MLWRSAAVGALLAQAAWPGAGMEIPPFLAKELPLPGGNSAGFIAIFKATSNMNESPDATPKTVKWKYFDPTRRITPESVVTAH